MEKEVVKSAYRRRKDEKLAKMYAEWKDLTSVEGTQKTEVARRLAKKYGYSLAQCVINAVRRIEAKGGMA